MEGIGMTLKRILFRGSYIFAMVGGLMAVLGGWLLAQPSVGANIGAGLLIMGATGLVFIAVVTCIAAWSTALVGRAKRRESLRPS